jgi:hypothetical protein
LVQDDDFSQAALRLPSPKVQLAASGLIMESGKAIGYQSIQDRVFNPPLLRLEFVKPERQYLFIQEKFLTVCGSTVSVCSSPRRITTSPAGQVLQVYNKEAANMLANTHHKTTISGDSRQTDRQIKPIIAMIMSKVVSTALTQTGS